MEFSLPTETIELPSKGKFYPEGHPLASGTVEMKYMTAKEEDILTNQNYINAKSQITRFQTKNDFVVFNNSYSNPSKISNLSPGKRLKFNLKIVILRS